MSDDEAEGILREMSQKLADKMMATLCDTGAFRKPRPTAIRLTSFDTFEVVDLDDEGKIIEPPRCNCGPVVHWRSDCPFAYGVS